MESHVLWYGLTVFGPPPLLPSAAPTALGLINYGYPTLTDWADVWSGPPGPGDGSLLRFSHAGTHEAPGIATSAKAHDKNLDSFQER